MVTGSVADPPTEVMMPSTARSGAAGPSATLKVNAPSTVPMFTAMVEVAALASVVMVRPAAVLRNGGAALALAGVALAQFAGAARDPVREAVAPVD